jgi:aminodeoxyfutalosine synthase
MLGLKIAQLSLFFGSDDLDGTVVEEKITRATGAATGQYLSRDSLLELIREAGYIPVERDTLYNHITEYNPEEPA